MDNYRSHEDLQKEDLVVLQQSVEILTSNLDFEETTQRIVNSIGEYLEALGGVLFLIDERNNRIYSHTITENKIVRRALKLLSSPLRSYSLPLDYAGKSITLDAIRSRSVKMGYDMRAFISPPLPRSIAFAIQKVTRTKLSIALPVIFKDKVLGVLWINFKEKEISNQKIALLKAFTHQVGIALYNALNVRLLKSQKDTLKQQNVRLKKLLTMRTEFLNVASHQLRTPISVIKGNVAMLLAGDYDDENPNERKEVYQEISDRVEKLLRIVGDILYASELDTDAFTLTEKEIEPIKIVLFLQQRVAERRNLSEQKSVTVEVKTAVNRQISVCSAERYLEVIFDNLLDNALLYTPSGGRVEIRVKSRSGMVRVEVKDTGIGIPKAEQAMLFTKFKRASNATLMHADGTGLGLFIVKKMIEGHPKGSFGFTSKEGKGSIFWVEFQQYGKETKE